jgi:tetratricopeptide (TPR) repeat protein
MDYYGPMSSPKRLATLSLLISLVCTAVVAAAPEEAPIDSGLGGELFYQLLVGEISAQNGDAASAYSLMLDAARKANSEQLFERTVNLALGARSGESALSAAQAWGRSFPVSAQANRYQLQILIGLNKISETVEPLKRALAQAKGHARIAVITQIPRYFARATDKKQATVAVEHALTTELSDATVGPSAWATVGTLRLMAGDVEGAANAARRGAAFNTHSDEVAALALGLWDAKSPAAEALLQHYLARKASPEIRLAYARRLLGAQRGADAYEQTVKATLESADYADAWLVRGSLEFRDKKNDASQASLQKYIALRTATVAVADAAEGQSGLTQAYMQLSQIAEQAHNPAEALAYLQKIDSTQVTLQIQSRKAAVLAQQGKMDEARALIRELPEQQADDARLKISAEVQLLRDNKQYAQAYALLAEAVQRFPDDADLKYDQAMVAEKLGRLPAMERLLREVIAAKPDYQHAYNALGYSLADRNLRLPEARSLIRKALELTPDDPFIMDSLAWVEFRSGNLAEALRVLTRAYTARPDAEIAAHLGEVLWALQRRDDARKTWKEGLALNPENETLLDTMRRLSKP